MDNSNGKFTGFYSKKLRAGKRRTYFFDVRSTKSGDFFLTITESKKKFDGEGYDSHKIFLYKEDFKKFLEGLNETVDHVKTTLMPDFDFDAFNHDTPYEGDENQTSSNTGSNEEVASADAAPSEPQSFDNGHSEDVDKW